MIKLGKCVICVAAGSSQVPLIRAIQSASYSCLAFDKNPEALGSEIADYFIQCGTYDAAEAIRQLYILKISPLAVMVKSAGYPVVTAAKIAEAFGLHFISSGLAENLISKDRLIQFCLANDIPVAESIPNCDSEQVPENFFPSVIRPNYDVRGRSTCFLVRNSSEFRQRMAEYPQPDGYSLSRFIGGYDLSLIAVFNSQQKILRGMWLRECTEFKTDGSIEFDGFRSVESVEKILVDQAKTIVHKIIKLGGAQRGCLNFSFRVNKEQELFLIEVHPDLVGENVMEEIVPSVLGRPLLTDLVRFYVGEIPMIDYLPEVLDDFTG